MVNIVFSDYQLKFERRPDFIVEYQAIFGPNMNDNRLYQGMRTDFLYEGDDLVIDGIWMIWPEFVDEKGEAIPPDGKDLIADLGRANMWIVNDELREYHQSRLSIGTKGFWVYGSEKVAKVTVIEILQP